MAQYEQSDSSREGFDLIIHGGTVVDGSGAPARRADVGIRGDRIVAVGALDGAEAHQRLDASGRVVAPGFIDAHTHDDRMVLSSPDMTAKLSQGVTSVIAGNCGVSLAPLVDTDPPPPLNLLGGREWFRYPTMAAYLDDVDRHPASVNIACMVGHSTLRAGIMDRLDRPASAAEIEHMAKRVDEAMDAGCIGMSTGLAYPPAINAPTEEVISLAERVARRGGLYATHMRNEKEAVVESVRETLEIGRRAGVPVVISHHKCSGRANFGLTRETLALIERARAQQTVNLDVYPYTASSTVLLAEWVPAAERVLVTWSHSHPECRGRDLAEIASEWGLDIDSTCARLQPAGAIYFQMDEA
ncbi:MAG: amidohydrolase family protein, partial [Gammaproteobacteria bacterium]|nr:amidohydrolase family protein [Gammaproteobacteria bacterium]